MQIFDGNKRAKKREEQLATEVQQLRDRGVQPCITAVLYTEDPASELYTRLKREAAERAGIEYRVVEVSLRETLDTTISELKTLAEDDAVTGIIIQKPSRQLWQKHSMVQGPPKQVRQAFRSWWHAQTQHIVLEKDVDGLHPETLQAIEAGNWKDRGLVLPATVKASLIALEASAVDLTDPGLRVAVLGRSDILGLPLFWELEHRGCKVVNYGSKDMQHLMETGRKLHNFDVVVTATGKAGLITGDMVDEGVVLIDVGEPKPDVDKASVGEKPSFLTPVPGGIGPLTVVSLLENASQLAKM